MFDTAVTLDQVIAYACVLAIVVLGALILRFTEAGLSVRAMVDSEAMTSLSGSNPSRIAAGVWVVSTFLAGPRRASSPRRSSASTRASSRCSSRPRSPRSSPPGCAACPIAVIVALLMGVAGSLVQYYLPPDSEITANIDPEHPVRVRRHLADRQHHPVAAASTRRKASAARSTAPSPRTAGAGWPRRPTPRTVYPKLNFFVPDLRVRRRSASCRLIFKPYWLGSSWPRGVALAVVFLSYTLVTGEGGMLWLCQITFAGVGALGTGAVRRPSTAGPILARDRRWAG